MTKRKLAHETEPNLSPEDYDKILHVMNARSSVENVSGCIIVDYRLSDGTAKIDYNNKSYRCHVIAFEAHNNGKRCKKDDQFVIHNCKQMAEKVRNCINPAHLIAVGKKEFMQLQSATPETIKRIKLVKQMHAEKKSVKEICEKASMKKTAVYAILNGQSWTAIH